MDSIYFIEDGEIRYKATFLEVQGGDSGKFRVCFFDMKRLRKPYKKHPGFRGFRYIDYKNVRG
jgi:hypothetical protein